VLSRVAVLLVAASGCDLVFDPEERPISVCGPYGDPVPLAFAPELGQVTGFSVDATGTRAFVHAKKLTTVKLVDGVWVEDAMRVANLDQVANSDHILEGRIAPTGDLFAAIAPPDKARYRIYHYKLAVAGWQLVEEVTPLSSSESTFPGGEFEIAANQQMTAFSRQVPVIHETDNLDRSVAIAVSDPPNLPFREVAIDGRLSTAEINDVHAPSQASLAGGPNGRLVMLYAATHVGEHTGSRIYLSEKKNNAFAVGVRVFEAEHAGEEVLEPWLSPDCATLYFRRTPSVDQAGTIYMATRTNPL
jgi:hypothetical protein